MVFLILATDIKIDIKSKEKKMTSIHVRKIGERHQVKGTGQKQVGRTEARKEDHIPEVHFYAPANMCKDG